MKNCPRCNALSPDEGAWCGICGLALAPPPQQPPLQAAVPVEGTMPNPPQMPGAFQPLPWETENEAPAAPPTPAAPMPPLHGQAPLPPPPYGFPPALVPPRKKKSSRRVVLLSVIAGVLLSAIAALMMFPVLRYPNAVRPVQPDSFGEEAPPETGHAQIPEVYAIPFWYGDQGRAYHFALSNEPTVIYGGENEWISNLMLYDNGRQFYYCAAPERYGEKTLRHLAPGNSPTEISSITNVDQFSVPIYGNSVFILSYNYPVYALYYMPDKDSDAVLLAQSVHSFVVSPNGEWVFYRTKDKDLYLLKVGESPRLITKNKDASLCFVSDDGSTFGYSMYVSGVVENAQILYLGFMEGGSFSTERVSTNGYYRRLYTNRTADDILVECEEGLFRFTRGTIAKIDNWNSGGFELLLPSFLREHSDIDYQTNIVDQSSFSSFYYLASNSSHKSGNSNSGGLYYKEPGGGVVELASGLSGFSGVLSNGGNEILCTAYSGGSRNLLRGTWQGDLFLMETLAEDVYSFQSSPDGKTIFFVRNTYSDSTSVSALYVWQNGQEKQIAEDMSSYYIGGPGGTMCTYITGADLRNNLAGQAWVYTAGDAEATLLHENAMHIEPAAADGSFYFLTNPIQDNTQNWRYTYDLVAYHRSESVQIAAGAEMPYSPPLGISTREALWYTRQSSMYGIY